MALSSGSATEMEVMSCCETGIGFIAGGIGQNLDSRDEAGAGRFDPRG